MDEDDDDDGMPDWWEAQYELNLLMDDASVYSDEDGYSNLEEYLAGTNPKQSDPHQLNAMPWIPMLLLNE